jgi:hypothetical protein
MGRFSFIKEHNFYIYTYPLPLTISEMQRMMDKQADTIYNIYTQCNPNKTA